MQHIGRVLIIFVAIACGAAAAIIALPILSLTDPVTREAGVILFIGSIISSFTVATGPEDVAGAMLMLMRVVTLAICIFPLALAALIGELGRLRGWLWYACCTGLVAAAMPWALRAGIASRRLTERAPGPDATQAETRFMLLFFLTGIIAGTVYWLIAGRNAGRDVSAPIGE